MAKSSLQDLFLQLVLCLGLTLQLGSCVEPNPYPYPSPVGYDCNSPHPAPPVSVDAVDQSIKDNIDKVVGQLVTRVVKTGFATASYGDGTSAAVYGLLQCRADVNSTDCAACAKEAKTRLDDLCAKDGKARLWFQHCFLRYDVTKFFGQPDRVDNYITYNNGPNAPNATAFQVMVGKLMRDVTAKAVAPGARALGTGQVKVEPKVTVYGLAECTRDLATSICTGCLATAVSKFKTCCVGKERGLVLFGSCKVEYEVYPFFFPVKA